ncbi:MAG: hypothetical protein JXA24_03670 [Proteobacteria bacterium]|nr:hypothetical protein [Pseudomonadota bacterium]
MPIIPLIILAAVALPLIIGCDRVKEAIEGDECAPRRTPDEYTDLSDEAYLTLRSLWPETTRDRPPWFERWMKSPEGVPAAMRNEVGAFAPLFATACRAAAADARADPKSTVIDEYRAATAESFQAYLAGGQGTADHGALVLLGMLAPVKGGDGMVIGAMNALNMPTEPMGRQREMRSALGQLVKAAFYYNAATRRAEPSARFSMERKRLRLKPADAEFVKANLRSTQEILGKINANPLTDQQRALCDALSLAAENLRKSVASR